MTTLSEKCALSRTLEESSGNALLDYLKSSNYNL